MCDKYKRDVKHPIYVLSFLNYIICKYSLLNTTMMHVYHYHSCISRVNFQCISKLKIAIPLPRPQMTVMASRITRQSSVCSTVCSDWQQRNIKCPLHCPCVRRINRWLVDSPHKGTVSRKTFPFDEVIMQYVFIPSASKKLKEGYTGFTLGSRFGFCVVSERIQASRCVADRPLAVLTGLASWQGREKTNIGVDI